MIDSLTIQKIFDTADILEVVSDFVSLKKRGANYVGRCPFHDEKTGSFTVSPSKGIYKCFGCGKGGNVVNFIMEHEQMTYVEALHYLAKRYNITIEERELSDEEKKEKSERESLLVVTAFAATYFTEQLLHTDEGKSVGLGYLHKRGLEMETIEKFDLGYCPDKWDGFTQAALAKGYKKEYLVKSGLTIDGDKGAFDRFRARVIFPIRDIAGKIIAFGGRIMTNDKKTAKYVNSPESEIYHKSRTLYGIYSAKKSIVQHDRCYLVEGYLDVISFQKKGIENTVASSGTSLTADQIRLIRRLTPNITIIYDGDAAGIKASLRGINLVLEEGLNVRTLLLPDGEDPDSFSQSRTPEELAAYIAAHETDFISFKTNLLLEQASGDPIERAKMITEVVRSISLIPDGITRSVYARETATRMQMEESVIFNEIARIRTQKMSDAAHRQIYIQQERKQVPPEKPDLQPQDNDLSSACLDEERTVMRCILLFGDKTLYREEKGEDGHSVSVGDYVIGELEEDELEMVHPAMREMQMEYVAHRHEAGFVPAKFFTSHVNPEVSRMAADILSEPYELSRMWTENGNEDVSEEKILPELVAKIVDNYKLRRVEIMIREADGQIQRCEKAADDEGIRTWIGRKNTLNHVRSVMNEKLRRTGVK